MLRHRISAGSNMHLGQSAPTAAYIYSGAFFTEGLYGRKHLMKVVEITVWVDIGMDDAGGGANAVTYTPEQISASTSKPVTTELPDRPGLGERRSLRRFDEDVVIRLEVKFQNAVDLDAAEAGEFHIYIALDELLDRKAEGFFVPQ